MVIIMNLSKTYFDLVKESTRLRAFRGAGILQGIFLAIALLPFILIYAVDMLIYGALIVTFKLLSTPFDYLHNFVKSEGESVKHATQAVIYFASFPLLLFIKFIMAFTVLFLCIAHLIVSAIGYIASFGGIKFSPFLLDEADRGGDHVVKHNYISNWVFIAIGTALLVFLILYLCGENFSFAMLYFIFVPIYTVVSRVFAKKLLPYSDDDIEAEQDTPYEAI